MLISKFLYSPNFLKDLHLSDVHTSRYNSILGKCVHVCIPRTHGKDIPFKNLSLPTTLIIDMRVDFRAQAW